MKVPSTGMTPSIAPGLTVLCTSRSRCGIFMPCRLDSFGSAPVLGVAVYVVLQTYRGLLFFMTFYST